METKERYITDYLFSTPSFLSGAATVMNLAGNFYDYNTAKNSTEADSTALENDFRMIGQDMFDAMESLLKEKEN